MLTSVIYYSLPANYYIRSRLAHSSPLAFVPKHKPVCEDDVKKVKDFFQSSKKIMILTGAGISTESGIPDYRSEGVGLYARSTYRPTQYQEFLKSACIRKRYWARNYVGWNRFSSVQPSATHIALKCLENLYKNISVIVTQNVDKLHNKAGSKIVIELHGTAYRVICLDCHYEVNRHKFQEELRLMNTGMQIISNVVRPDGDVELSQADVEDFQVPCCPHCQGILKPDIVFFGDNVPKERVELVKQFLEVSDSLLVLGSSLSVFSGYRFILKAFELNRRIGIINIGKTRGDAYAQFKIDTMCGDVLSRVVK